MAYIGKNLVGVLKENRTVVTSTGDGSTSLELNETPGSVNNVLVFLDGIRQQPTTDYTVSGSMLTFTTGPETGVKIVAIVGNHSGVEPKKGSVTTRKIVDGAVTGQKLADGNIPTSKFSGALPAIDGSNLIGVHSDTIHKSPNDPAINTNTIDGQTVTLGQIWVNTTSGEMYICTDVTENAQHWINVGAGEGDYTNVPPTNPTNTGTFQNVSKNVTYNFTFDGSTDSDGSVTHYMVDNISPVGALTVASTEVAATTAHTFTGGDVGSDTPVTFRVRAKDNDGGYSSGVTVSMTVLATIFTTATGGVVNAGTVSGNYTYHQFNSTGTFTVSQVGTDPTIEYIVIAGGGDGGGASYASGAGGGGAGGYRSSVVGEQSGGGASAESKPTIQIGSYTATIGAGGTGVGNGGQKSGVASSFSGPGISTITTEGGGYGIGYGSPNGSASRAGNGGSGGGCSWHNSAPTNPPSGDGWGLGTSNEGYHGGNAVQLASSGGGGGGAGAVGQNSPADLNTAGDGGAGIASSITGASVARAGGGGGGVCHYGPYGTSASGQNPGTNSYGGGRGADYATPQAGHGTQNTGGGGGGGQASSGGQSQGGTGQGGSGVVIVRYRSS